MLSARHGPLPGRPFTVGPTTVKGDEQDSGVADPIASRVAWLGLPPRRSQDRRSRCSAANDGPVGVGVTACLR